jgi:hypothetical protein
MQTFDVSADWLVELDLVFIGECQQRRGREHFCGGAQTKKHFGLQRRGCFDIGNTERFLIYDAVAADNGDDGARRILLFELFRHEFVELAEVD